MKYRARIPINVAYHEDVHPGLIIRDEVIRFLRDQIGRRGEEWEEGTWLENKDLAEFLFRDEHHAALFKMRFG